MAVVFVALCIINRFLLDVEVSIIYVHTHNYILLLICIRNGKKTIIVITKYFELFIVFFYKTVTYT